MFNIIFPDYYLNDEFIQFETESKGYLYGVKIEVELNVYELVFYDAVRLKQDAEELCKELGYFHEPNLIILDKVSKESIEKAILTLIEKDELKYLLSTDQ